MRLLGKSLTFKGSCAKLVAKEWRYQESCFLTWREWEIDGPRKKRMSGISALYLLLDTQIFLGHLLWSKYALVNLKTRASFMGMRLTLLSKATCLGGPMLGLMFYWCCLESFSNFETKRPMFSFCPGLSNYVACLDRYTISSALMELRVL